MTCMCNLVLHFQINITEAFDNIAKVIDELYDHDEVLMIGCPNQEAITFSLTALQMAEQS